MSFYLVQFYNIVERNLAVVFVFIMGFERVLTEFLKIFVRIDHPDFLDKFPFLVNFRAVIIFGTSSLFPVLRED
ncbi:MAG: hypothetical protein ACFFCW_16305 [Candidatus Hodarchaeota archaeon]